MSAPHVTIFLSPDIDGREMAGQITNDLSLSIDHVASNSPYIFSAQRRDLDSYILVELDDKPEDEIGEMLLWDSPSCKYKDLLGACTSSVCIHYRGLQIARRALISLAQNAGAASSHCIIENGHGCLLLLSDVTHLVQFDVNWHWEKRFYQN